MFSVIEKTRLRVSKDTKPEKKSQFGQYLTPEQTAKFMANLFEPSNICDCRLLDAGAGIGSLSSAFIERYISGDLDFNSLEISTYEIDNLLHGHLSRTFLNYSKIKSIKYNLFCADFIEESINMLNICKNGYFTHAILNPPYKKIKSNSYHRQLLRQVEIETVNLYSAFVALTLALMAPHGQVVAIIPRSFCNGPYYRPFRDFIFEHAAIRQIHLFDSRSRAFKDDGVLQENIIILLERGGQQGDVTVTTSTDDCFTDLVTHHYPFERIVLPEDSERFIHIPTSQERNSIELSTAVKYTLDDLGIKVSTGPVVDFRLKEHLREMPGRGSVPLLYPVHFSGHNIRWPKMGIKKPNAIQRNTETEKWLYPNGFYCVVRRFSSKEEKRRIVASVIQPDTFNGAEMLGLENHLNVYHENKSGLPEALARGLATYLNTTGVDENFRRSSGHTQVNATDLKTMKYPSRKTLIALGEWAALHGEPTQAMIDEQFGNLAS